MNFFRGMFWALIFEALVFGVIALAVYAVLYVVG